MRKIARSVVSTIALANCVAITGLAAEAVDAPSVAAVSVDPSGVTVPRGDLPGWRQVFVEDFATDVPVGSFDAVMGDRWRAYADGWKDTSKQGTYRPSKVLSVQDGVLRKFLHTENGEHRVAAILPRSAPGELWLGTKYGRFEVRARADDLYGYKVAWLLWPDAGSNLTYGEINWPEQGISGDWEYTYGYMHYTGATVGSDQYWARAVNDFSQWHTYTIEWSPDLVKFFLDGREVGRVTERIPNTSMHWVLQTETATWMDVPDTSNGTVEIDWVSVWSYDP